MSDADFMAVRDYLASTAGLAFDQSRRPGLAVVVAERVRATGSASVADYLALLADRQGSAERDRLLDGVTVQETHFFRNTAQMEALRLRVLPDLLRRAAHRQRPLTVWSAGCSTGEEAYTLAMLILGLQATGAAGPPGPAPRIVATDISPAAVRAAARATYRGRTLAAMPTATRNRFLEPRSGGVWAVREQVRDLVDVRVHNLVAEPPPFGPGEVDLVLCRNVTIYFSRTTTRALIGGFHDVLTDGGYLLLGHSETLWQVSDAFTLVPMGEAFVYRRGRARVVERAPVTVERPVQHRAPRPVARRRTTVPDPLSMARAALMQGDYRGAVQAAEQATTANSLNAEAYVVLGHARSTLGQDADAIDPLRKAVYLDPSAGHAHFLLGGALARTGQHGAAAVSYRAAARALPSVPQGVLDAYLGGRSTHELVDVCQRLARAALEHAADEALAAGSSAS